MTTTRAIRPPSAPPRTAVRPPAGAVPPGRGLALPSSVNRTLRQVMVRYAAVSGAECAAVLLTALPALWLIQATADWWLHLPWLGRLILLLVDAAIVAGIVCRFGIRPLRKVRSRQSAALRVERAVPELRSALIAAVELSGNRPDAARGSVALVSELFAQLNTTLPTLDAPRRAVPTATLKTWARRAALSTAVALAAAACLWPKSLILFGRIFLSTTPVPTRTVVIPLTQNEDAVAGTSVRLAARAEGVVPRTGTLHLVYPNGNHTQMPALPSPIDGTLFEVTLQNVQQSFSYHFTLNDGTGGSFAVSVRTAPVLETLRLYQKFPDYTGLPEAELTPGNLTLRAGSEVRVEGAATAPLREASIRLEGTAQSIPAEIGQPGPASLQGRFRVPAEDLTGISFPLVNLDGVASRNETIYRVALIPDLSPVVELLSPATNRVSVLLQSKPRLIFTVADDFAVQRAVLKFEVTRPTFPGGVPVVEKGEVPIPLENDGSGTQAFVWDLAAQKPALTEGCSLTYWIEASDNNDVTGPGIGRTAQKTFEIVTEAEKHAELIEQLGARASQIEQVSETQKKVNQDLDGVIRKTRTPTTP